VVRPGGRAGARRCPRRITHAGTPVPLLYFKNLCLILKNSKQSGEHEQADWRLDQRLIIIAPLVGSGARVSRQAAGLRHGAVCRGEVASLVDFLTRLTFFPPGGGRRSCVRSARACFRARLCAVHLLLSRRLPTAGARLPTRRPGRSGHRVRRTDACLFFIPAVRSL
jgi:hypothetical protein